MNNLAFPMKVFGARNSTTKTLIQYPFSIAAILFVASAAVYADVIPTHANGPYLDPFIAGAVAGGRYGPPADGTPGELVAPFSAAVPWSVGFTSPAYDGISDTAAIWHWEYEVDIIDLTGKILTSIDGSPYELLTYDIGTDIIIDVHQKDLAGSGTTGATSAFAPYGQCDILGNAETGSVCKSLLNLTSSVIAWGTSVTEAPGVLGTFVAPQHGETPYMTNIDVHNTVRIEELSDGRINIKTVSAIPIPSAVWLFSSGLLSLILMARKKL